MYKTWTKIGKNSPDFMPRKKSVTLKLSDNLKTVFFFGFLREKQQFCDVTLFLKKRYIYFLDYHSYTHDVVYNRIFS